MILVLVLIFFLTERKHKLLLRESVSPRSPCHPLPSITTPLLTPPPSPRQPLPSITSPLAPPPNQCHGPSLRPNPETRHRNMSPQIAPTQPSTSEPNRGPNPLLTPPPKQDPKQLTPPPPNQCQDPKQPPPLPAHTPALKGES